jgi:hypothetical protein
MWKCWLLPSRVSMVNWMFYIHDTSSIVLTNSPLSCSNHRNYLVCWYSFTLLFRIDIIDRKQLFNVFIRLISWIRVISSSCLLRLLTSLVCMFHTKVFADGWLLKVTCECYWNWIDRDVHGLQAEIRLTAFSSMIDFITWSKHWLPAFTGHRQIDQSDLSEFTVTLPTDVIKTPLKTVQTMQMMQPVQSWMLK